MIVYYFSIANYPRQYIYVNKHKIITNLFRYKLTYQPFIVMP